MSKKLKKLMLVFIVGVVGTICTGTVFATKGVSAETNKSVVQSNLAPSVMINTLSQEIRSKMCDEIRTYVSNETLKGYVNLIFGYHKGYGGFAGFTLNDAAYYVCTCFKEGLFGLNNLDAIVEIRRICLVPDGIDLQSDNKGRVDGHLNWARNNMSNKIEINKSVSDIRKSRCKAICTCVSNETLKGYVNLIFGYHQEYGGFAGFTLNDAAYYICTCFKEELFGLNNLDAIVEIRRICLVPDGVDLQPDKKGRVDGHLNWAKKYWSGPIAPRAQGYYVIETSVAENKCVQVDLSQQGKEAKIGDFLDKMNQIFWLSYDPEDGCYTVINLESSEYLGVKNAVDGQGTNVCLGERDSLADFKWKIISLEGGLLFELELKSNGMKLDLRGGNIANGTPLQIWPSNGSPAQKFRLVRRHI